MLAIQLGNNDLIIREKMRQIQRDEDRFYIELGVALKYGAVFKQEYAPLLKYSININFSKYDNDKMWKDLKDTDADSIIKYYFTMITNNVTDVRKEKEYLSKKEKDEKYQTKTGEALREKLGNKRRQKGQAEVLRVVGVLDSIDPSLLEDCKLIEV